MGKTETRIFKSYSTDKIDLFETDHDEKTILDEKVK